MLIGVAAAALVLVGGGIAAAVTILGGDDPNPQTSSDPTRETPTDAPSGDAECADSPGLTDEECTLLNEALAANVPLDPADCESIDPLDAPIAITCFAIKDGNGFRPDFLNIYGYGDATSMDESFQSDIDSEGLAGPQKLDGAPGWGTWSYDGETDDAGRVLLRYGNDSDTSYVAWTDTDTLIEISAEIDGNQLPEMYEWWASA